MLLLPEHMFTKAPLYQTSAGVRFPFWTDYWLAFLPNSLQPLKWPLDLEFKEKTYSKPGVRHRVM